MNILLGTLKYAAAYIAVVVVCVLIALLFAWMVTTPLVLIVAACLYVLGVGYIEHKTSQANKRRNTHA